MFDASSLGRAAPNGTTAHATPLATERAAEVQSALWRIFRDAWGACCCSHPSTLQLYGARSGSARGTCIRQQHKADLFFFLAASTIFFFGLRIFALIAVIFFSPLWLLLFTFFFLVFFLKVYS
jgi:hypothetical protein